MAEVEVGSNFVREIVEEDLKNGKNGGGALRRVSRPSPMVISTLVMRNRSA